VSLEKFFQNKPAPYMKIGIVCYPTFGGSGVVATELGMGLAKKGHEVHFITYRRPARLSAFHENVFYHEVTGEDYPLFEYPPYDTALASKMVEVVKYENLDLLHVHYAIPHAAVAYMAKKILLQARRGVFHQQIGRRDGSLGLPAGRDPVQVQD
jgi:L-malate glycosyltransferase